MANSKIDYRCAVAVNVAIQAVGVASGVALMGAQGWSATTIAMAWAIQVLCAATGEAFAYFVLPVRLRQTHSLARRARRVGVVGSAGIVMTVLALLNQKSGLLAGIGTSAPQYLPLVVLLGASDEAIVSFVRYLSAAMVGIAIAGALVVAITASYWRVAPAREIARLHRGRAATATQDLVVVFVVPLVATTIFAMFGNRHAAILANALTLAAVLADLPFWISARISRELTPKSAVRSLKWKIGSVLTLGLVCASTLSSIVWNALGQGLAAAFAGLVTMVLMLVATSWVFWRQSLVWTSIDPAQPIDRVKWITQLFVVALFLYPLSWARELEVFKVHKLAELFWSPRLLLTVTMACAAAGLLYVLQNWLHKLDQRDAR